MNDRTQLHRTPLPPRSPASPSLSAASAAKGRAIRRADARLLAPDAAGAIHRFLLGPRGNFLVNTPLFLLPARLDIRPRHRVLDLRAGRAAIGRFLAARIPFERRPAAIDWSPASLQMARRDLGEASAVDLVAGRPSLLPFAPSSFDLVIAAHVFRHLDDGELMQCVREAARVLRPGGVLVGWDYASLGSRTLNRLHARLLASDPEPPRLRGFGPLAHAAVDAGFAIVERPLFRPFLFPPMPHTAILAQKARQAEDTSLPILSR